MYTGPGPGPLLTAAAAWDGLAAGLSRTAADYGSVVADITTGSWRGPASAAVAAAAAPYVAWMGSSAAQVARTAAQAKAAAGAYEAAFAMTVPPPVIVANRAQLTSLVATNLLGQNTPAIAATEAQYAEMWAQDTAAMYGYAGSSAAAADLTSFPGPPQATNTAAETQTTLSQLMSSVPTTLQALAGPGLGGVQNWLGLGGVDVSSPAGILSLLGGTDGSPLGAFINDNALNTIFSSGFYMPGNFLGNMVDFLGLQGAGAAAADAAGAAENAAGAATGGLGQSMGGLGGTVSAGLGHAASIGPLSVPPAWTATGPLGAAASALPGPGVLGSLGNPAAQGPASMLGGMPLSAPGGRGFVPQMPRYGSTPTVMPRVPAVG